MLEGLWFFYVPALGPVPVITGKGGQVGNLKDAPARAPRRDITVVGEIEISVSSGFVRGLAAKRLEFQKLECWPAPPAIYEIRCTVVRKFGNSRAPGRWSIRGERIQVAMLCAECDGGQYANDQGTEVAGCAGCLPCFEDGCSRHHLPAEKCGRRCSSTDASTWQDGLVAILRDALREDTAKDTDPLLLLLSVWSRIGID